jgi:hypothetical protein
VSQPVFLLDVDGVLVKPGGYRKSTQATLDWFTRRMGIADVLYSEAIFNYFEACNISSEFDIVPLCLAEIFDRLCALYPEVRLPVDLYQACDRWREIGAALPKIDFTDMVDRVAKDTKVGRFPSDVALEANRSEINEPPFPHLTSHPLLEKILSHTRDIQLSQITPLFQQFALGSELFRTTYNLPSEIETGSFLLAFDEPLLDGEIARSLNELWKKGNLSLVAYTGRPSKPLDEVIELLLPYAPEANLALEVAGLAGIPIIGLGQIFRQAEITGRDADELGKPSLISALGAIGAAVSGNEREALQAAERWIHHGEECFFKQLPALDIHLFEDTPGSIRFTKQAVAMLNESGVPARFQAWGIAHTERKINALRSAGAEVREDINTCLHCAMNLGLNLSV